MVIAATSFWLANDATLAQTSGFPYAAITLQKGNALADFIADASLRFRVPEVWIRAVIRAESNGDPAAVSHKGAVGLMQVMPETYAGLRVRHGLGPDPFDPRDNILAGTAYLRNMHDRFGPVGMLAAYNAGPARYEDYLATGRRLPAETRDYVAMLAPIVGVAHHDFPPAASPNRRAWAESPLFTEHHNDAPTTRRAPVNEQAFRSETAPAAANTAARDTLFVPRSSSALAP